MDITLSDAGKRYRTDWIFRNLNYTFRSGKRYAILGPNGSGKSTLLKTLSGHLSLSKGNIRFHQNESDIDPDRVYRLVSFAAPYIELIEEFSLKETLEFHARMKPFLPGFSPESVFDAMELPKTRFREIRHFSSGMKQRVKLALAILSDTPLVLLDEPGTNLDAQSVKWFHQLLHTHAGNRLLIIASNDPDDLVICEEQLNIMAFKPAKNT